MLVSSELTLPILARAVCGYCCQTTIVTHVPHLGSAWPFSLTGAVEGAAARSERHRKAALRLDGQRGSAMGDATSEGDMM